MREINIGRNQEGQRLDRFLAKYMKNASGGFIQKMIRKKNITINGKKAGSGDLLACGDRIQIYFSEETLEKFCGPEKTGEVQTTAKKPQNEDWDGKIRVLFESKDILAFHKPAGLLSQKMDASTYSLNDYLIEYCLREGSVKQEELDTFKPSVANRLDRNTTGIVLCGKTVKGLRQLASLQRSDAVEKHYLCLVKGVPEPSAKLKGWLIRDARNNQVTIYDRKEEIPESSGGKPLNVETWYERLGTSGEISLLKVRLITGRTHQIRAHMAHIGHPVAGDIKYGDVTFNRMMRDKYKVRSQMLHCTEVAFTSALTGNVRITDPMPENFVLICEKAGL